MVIVVDKKLKLLPDTLTFPSHNYLEPTQQFRDKTPKRVL